MTKVGESLIRGAKEAAAYAKGEKFEGRITTIYVPDNVDVTRIRRKLKMTQAEFAGRFGIKLATLQDWEQKRRTPDTPARVLLTVIAKEPEAVLRALRG